jgi:hypothetical protein
MGDDMSPPSEFTSVGSVVNPPATRYDPEKGSGARTDC